MQNCLTHRYTLHTALAGLIRRPERVIPPSQASCGIGRVTVVPAHRISLHRAKRARAVLVASAADVIDRAL